MTLGIGLIGVGRMGQVHAHHLSYNVPGVTLIAVADLDAGRAADVAARFAARASYADYHELLARQDIEAVVIVTPTHTHAEVITAAAAARKHIFVEKPVALTLADCDRALEATRRAGVKLQVGLMRRFDPAYVAAKEKIDRGVIGDPVMFKGTGRDPKRTSLEFARREHSGGLIADMGIHEFDLARWLMGSEVVRVQSEGACLVYSELREVGDIDNAVVNLAFENGAIGNVDLSRNAIYGYDIRTEVLGSKGSLLIGRLQQTPVLVLTAGGVTHDTVPYFMERFGEAYAAEIRAFAECVLKDLPPRVSGDDARAAMLISLAATRSLDEGRAVPVAEA